MLFSSQAVRLPWTFQTTSPDCWGFVSEENLYLVPKNASGTILYVGVIPKKIRIDYAWSISFNNSFSICLAWLYHPNWTAPHEGFHDISVTTHLLQSLISDPWHFTDPLDTSRRTACCNPPVSRKKWKTYHYHKVIKWDTTMIPLLVQKLLAMQEGVVAKVEFLLSHYRHWKESKFFFGWIRTLFFQHALRH